MGDNTCSTKKKIGVKLTGVLAGLGVNLMTEKLGLAPIPMSNGDSFDFNPGYVLKQEIYNLCSDGKSQSIYPVTFSSLSRVGQGLLLDRMQDLYGKASDKPLLIAGKRFEGSFPLSFINLPGEGSVVLWYNPKMDISNPKLTDVNGLMLKWKFDF